METQPFLNRGGVYEGGASRNHKLWQRSKNGDGSGPENGKHGERSTRKSRRTNPTVVPHALKYFASSLHHGRKKTRRYGQGGRRPIAVWGSTIVPSSVLPSPRTA